MWFDKLKSMLRWLKLIKGSKLIIWLLFLYDFEIISSIFCIHLQGWAAVAAALGQLGYAMPAAPAATAAPAPVTAPAAAAPETDPLASVLASLGLGNINLGALNNLDLSSLSSIPGLESLASIPGLESLFPATSGMGTVGTVGTVAPGIVPSRSRGKGKAPKGKSFGKGKPLTQDRKGMWKTQLWKTLSIQRLVLDF